MVSHPFAWLPHGKNGETLTWYVTVNVHSGKTTRSTGSPEFQVQVVLRHKNYVISLDAGM